MMKESKRVSIGKIIVSSCEWDFISHGTDKLLRHIPPESDRESLFHEVHSGIFGAHLKDAQIHRGLLKHYWWPKMRADICK